MACLSPEDVLQHLIEVDDGNLDSLPEVQAMRQILVRNPGIDRDSVSKLCVGAALNDYQEMIPANPGDGSYWGRFVDWALDGGHGNPPWRRFPNVKARRFERFRNSTLWRVQLLSMNSGELRANLAAAMRQSPLQKTIVFAPLVLARWAYVLGHPFRVVPDHPLPVDSRIARLLVRIPGFNPHAVIQRANAARQNVGRRDLNMSDFDAWAWQHFA